MRELSIYVDGSYREEKIGQYKLGIVGYGAIVVEGCNVVYTFMGYTTDPEYTVHHNPSGELMAVIKTLDTLSHSIKKGDAAITIFHDYKGIAEWALGTWKRNIRLTKDYKELMDIYSRKFDIKFRKVKALHKNKKDKKHVYTIHNEYNDMADELANRAINIFIEDHSEIDLDNLQDYQCDFGTF